MHIAVLYEHPTWSLDLIEKLNSRGLSVRAFDVGKQSWQLPLPQFDMWINRVNAMPSSDRPANVVAATRHLLQALQYSDQLVLNGLPAFLIGGSKAAQTQLFSNLGLHTPASVAVHSAETTLEAARQIGFPVLTKPNNGGSGSGIVRYDSESELKSAIDNDKVVFGTDQTGLVQEVINSADGLVHRIEMLGDTVFYASRQAIQNGVYNYCAADGCAIDGNTNIEIVKPNDDAVSSMTKVMAATHTHFGAIEYLVDAKTNEPCFYDFNPYSNFVEGHNLSLGFDPVERFIDFALEVGGEV